MFLIDVVEVTPLDGRRLELTFEDGLKAVVDLDRIIQPFDGVFAPLKDPDYFRLVRVDPKIGTIVWPNEADLCPDVTLFLCIRQTDCRERRAGPELSEAPVRRESAIPIRRPCDEEKVPEFISDWRLIATRLA